MTEHAKRRYDVDTSGIAVSPHMLALEKAVPLKSTRPDRYDPEHKCVYLGEYETWEMRDSEPVYHELAELPPGSFRLVTVERKIDQDGAVLRIVSGCQVGAERMGDFTVIVRPKVAAADFFTMVNFAFNFRLQFTQDIVGLAEKERNLTALFLYGFLRIVSEFVRTGLRSAFVEREEDFQSKAKGRILLGQYISRQKPIMKDHVVPCRYFEIHYDCLENQIVRYTVEVVCHTLLQMVVSRPLRRSVQQLYAEIVRRMPSVSSRRITRREFGRVRYAGKFASYEPIHTLCRLILESIQIDLTTGQFRFQSFALDMNDLFERFVIGVLRKEAGLNVTYQKGEQFSVGTQ